MALSRSTPLRDELARALPDRPFAIEFWDGSTLPPTNGTIATTFRVKSPQALAHALRAPGQLGIGRAYVAGALDVDDLDATLELLDAWKPPALDGRAKARLVAAAVRSTGLVLPPKPPTAELRPRGRRHSILRDRAAVRHHYDVSNDYFALFLDDSMTYSCAVFSRGATTLEEAQFVKRELVCTKLGLKEGERVLDVGCGWGAFAVHAAVQHGVHVTGITLSEPQAQRARQRAEEAGVADRVDIKVMDWRELHTEPFDAIASIGMVEHVGSGNIDNYARHLREMLRPGGRLLNHGIARLRHGDPEAGPFSERYVFPDAAPLHLSRISFALEGAGLEITHAEGFREDYAETLRHWSRKFDDNLPEAIRLGGEERVRVWRLYLRAARRGFESGFLSIFQVVAHRS
ncbi:MAG: cyclopropane-fatty-acyl-phospholipid synthase [Baekduia sp.]|jgi:cyclopropane-fatty-acyl-phospholipid synthase|nr:cyclopropane-fatty-acyl-phospholipid synthase [Baekduia sp.]